jgi:phage head maturation protease
MSDTAYAWAPITKTVQEDDGTLLVYGPAASSALDRDQQRLDETWLDQAMPRWMAEGGGVREQHDSKRAVGVGVGLSKGDDGTHLLAARIVDPVAIKKIEHGVLRGFSVGIKNPKVQMGKADAPNGLVVGGDVIEVSVVDRPANPECRFDMAKADAAGELQLVEDAQVVEKTDGPGAITVSVAGSILSMDDLRALVGEQMVKLGANVPIAKADLSTAGRKKAAASGAAMPDGSYPITTKADLRKAIKAVGRGGTDHDAIRRHIITRAKALGLEAMVPTDWNADGSIDDTQKADMVAKAEQVLRDVRGLLPDLAKADDEPDSEPPAGETEGGDEAPDIATAGEAIAAIAKLIISEAESLAAGNINEACDIALLLDAVRSLKWFQDNERYEETAMAEAAKTDTTETADNAKTDAVTPQPDTEAAPKTTETPQVPDTLKADIADLVKSAVAEASKTAEERINALAADLAKAHGELTAIKAQPAPGGPVLARTATQQQQARASDADRMRAEAAELMAKADNVSDRTLRDGYIERAQALLIKADD